jgi:hypothetical protein
MTAATEVAAYGMHGIRDIRIPLDQSNGVDRRGDYSDECSGVRPAKYAIVAAEAVRHAEKRSGIGIGSHKTGCDPHDGDRRIQCLPLASVPGAKPRKINRQFHDRPGKLSIPLLESMYLI